MNLKIEPLRLQRLLIHKACSEAFVGRPDHLESMTFEGKFDRSLVGVRFPSTLRSLTLGEMFNQSISDLDLEIQLCAQFLCEQFAPVVMLNKFTRQNL